MKLLPIINQLKAATTLFAGRIAGASEYANEVVAASMQLPCAFVMRGSITTPENPDAVGELVQVLTEEFGVAVAVDNSLDGRGQAAEEFLDDIRTELLKALLGWQPPDPDQNTFVYAGEQPLEINRGRLWRLFLFSTMSTRSSLDL